MKLTFVKVIKVITIGFPPAEKQKQLLYLNMLICVCGAHACPHIQMS